MRGHRSLVLFDDIVREDASPKRNIESLYAFYNRSARPEIQRIRALLEEMFLRFPEPDQRDVRRRIGSGNDSNFESAFFEVFLHELLLRSGCEVECHPQMENGVETRPDFFVTHPDGSSFYLEAVLASEANERDEGAEARKGVVLDVLDSSPHENFVVSISSTGNPQTQPSGRRLSRMLHSWLDQKNPEQVQLDTEAQGFGSLEPFLWSHEDWELEIRPIALGEDRRGKSTRLIGVRGGEAGWIGHWTPIRNALRNKGSRYGVMDRPFVIAVNFNVGRLERMDEMQALFGQEQYTWHAGETEREPEWGRVLNGFWVSGEGPRYRRVSCVWLFAGLEPSRLANCGQTVYVNPWGTHPAPEVLLDFPCAVADGETMNWSEGQSIGTALHLEDGWPE